MKTEELSSAMHEAARKGQQVRIVDTDDIEYVGKAIGYTKADDEENGFATISVRTEDKGGWALATNEIKTFEVVE